MKKLFKWLGILLLVLLLLILLVAGAIYFLAGTDKGFSLTTKELSKRVPGLTLTQAGGNLVNGVQAEGVNFENDTIKLQADGISSQWRLSCLTDKEFCLDTLVIDSVNVETFASEEPKPTEASGPIELPDITLPIGVNLQDILVRRLSLKLPGEAPPIVVNDITVSAKASDNTLTLSTLSAVYDTYSASVIGDITLSDDYPLDVKIALDALDILPEELPDGAGEQAAKVDIHLTQSLEDLQLNVGVSGSISATVTGSVQPLNEKLPANITISSPTLGWPLLSQTQVAATNTIISVDGTLDDYAVTLLTRVEGEQIPATTLQLSGVANTERAKLPAISIDTLDGTALGQAEASWVDGINWNTQWTLENINPEVYRADIKGMLDGQVKAAGTVSDGNWSLDVPLIKINGTLQDYPFDLDVKLAKALDNVWSIEKARLNNGQNRINAFGNVSDTWDITVAAALPELTKLLPELSGGFNADVTMAGELETPDVNLVASTAGFAYNEIQVNGFSLIADIKELLNKDSDINLAIGSVVIGENTIQNGRFTLQGKRSDHTLALFADGPEATAIQLSSSGSLNEKMDWEGSLDAVTLEVPAHTINLEQPTRLSWNNALQKFAVDAHCWVTEGSKLCLENEVLAESSGNAIVSLDQYSLNRLDPFLPAQTNMTGQLSLNTDIKWGEDQPGGFSALLQANIDEGGAQVSDETGETVSFTYDSLALTTQANPNKVDAEIQLDSNNLGNAAIAFTMDPSLEAKPINGSVKLAGFDIGIAKAFLPDFDEITGELNIDGDVSGTLTDPRFDGKIVIDTPIVRAEILPLPITGGNITTTVQGRRAFIDGALNSDEGSITIEGAANWRQLNAWAAEVTLTGDALNIQSDPIQESQVDHQIRINATPRNIQVSGTIDIPMAVIDVGELPQGAATVSSDIVIVEDIEEAAQSDTAIAASKDAGIPLIVDIDIVLGDEVALSAYGLTANLTGDISVLQKSPNPPQLGGEIEIVDGIFKQYGQDLEATGQIIFVGPVNQTRLDIDAVRTIDSEDRVAGLRIEGTVAVPETSLFTEPGDKQQDAILSYIVLGRDINDDTSSQEANLLASAALALTVKGGQSIAGGLANVLGVQNIAFETQGQGDDTQLVVSGRVNDRLLLRYGRSVFAPESTLYLRYDLSKKLYLEAAQSAERAVDIFYQFSF